MASIYITDGPNDGDYYPLEEDRTYVVGRGDADILVVDEQVSKAHLQITWNAGAGTYMAEDLKSSNGTWLGGNSLTRPITLQDGDRLEMGTSAIEFSTQTYSDKAAAKAASETRSTRHRDTLLDQ
jgi:pSer/pThr/pTyr-binding forkhead associated (FHA) protein